MGLLACLPASHHYIHTLLIASSRLPLDSHRGSDYFGGDGPHYGVRNSSLALSTFRPYGLAGVGAASGWATEVRGRTVPHKVSAPRLYLTCDTDMRGAAKEQVGRGYSVPAGSVRLLYDPAKQRDNRHDEQQRRGAGATTIKCEMTGKNATDAVASCDLSSLVGQMVVFDVQVEGGALLYTLRFGA